MSGGNGHIQRLGASHFCTIQRAEELAHTAYLAGRKEAAEDRQNLVRAFEARIAGLEARLATVEEANVKVPAVEGLSG